MQLKAIKTKAYCSSSGSSVCSAIQLVLENGLESPVFDCHSTYGTADKEFTTVELTGKNIKRIRGQTNSSSGHLGSMIVEHENGSQTIYDRGYSNNSLDLSIPEGYGIVGVYGRISKGSLF